MRSILILWGLLFAFVNQAATIRGQVTSGRGEVLVGAVVVVQGTGFSAPADASGRYEISNVPAGSYVVRASFVGYQEARQNVVLRADESVELGFVLQEQAQHLGDVTVVGKLNQEEENASRLSERTADNVINVIGARAMERSPDINAANVLQRVSGVTIQRSSGSDGAYAVIRGLAPRYNNTLVNGIKIASPDNVNRYVALDVVPSDLLKRIEVTKALLPSMEADAIGGTVNLVMKDAPDSTELRVTASGGYSQLFFGRKFDDFAKGDIQSESLTQRYGADHEAVPSDFSRSNLKIVPKQAPPTYLASLTYGHRYLRNRLGVLVAVNTQNQFYGSDGEFTTAATGPDNQPYPVSISAPRHFSNHQRNSGVVTHVDFNLSERHKLALDNVLLLSDFAQLRTTVDTFLTDQRRGPGTGTTNYNTRSLTTRQVVENAKLSGRHELAPRLLFDWAGVYSLATRNAPDEASLNVDFLLSPQADGSIRRSPEYVNGANRIWQHNRDRDYSGLANLTWQVPLLGREVEFRAGGLYRTKQRYNLQNEYQLKAAQAANGVKQLFTGIDAAQFTVYNPQGTYDADVANYTASENVAAGYAQAKLALGPVQVLGGVRVESTRQEFATKAISTAIDRPTAFAKSYTDVLPSLHLKYGLGDRQNLRLSYFASLSRPNYYELVPYKSRGVNFDTQGNPYLKRATADNLDLRYEIYPSAEDYFTVGAFYKRIADPIELSFSGIGGGQLVFQSTNAPTSATIAGLEASFTKFLGHWGVMGNYTYAHSAVSSYKVVNNAATGLPEFPLQERPLQGQADHIANVSLLFRDLPTGFYLQTSYQYTGRTLQLVQASFDYYQLPQSSLAVSVEKRIERHFTAFAKLNNLLNTPSVLKINNSALVTQRDSYQATYLLGLRYAL